MIVIPTLTGQISRHVLELLVNTGEVVRVITPDPSRLDPEVWKLAEVVQGPHEDPAFLAEAFRDADTVLWSFHAQSVSEHDLEMTLAVGEAMKGQGVRRVVALTGQSDGGVQDPDVLGELFKNTETSYRTLQLPALMDDLLTHHAESISSQGVFFGTPSGEQKFSVCAAHDVASVAATLLLDHWSGQESVLVLGPENLSFDDMARIMSEVLGRPIRYEQTSGGAHEAAAVERVMDNLTAQDVITVQAQVGPPVSNPGSRTQSMTPTTFRQWCKSTLKPAVLACRAQEVLTAFAHLSAADPVLAALIDQRPDYQVDAWRRELPVMDLFGCLLAQIIGQQISLKAARAILGRLSARFGDQVPSARQAATLDEQTLRDVGLTWRKAKTVLDLAARFNDGRLSEQRLRALSDEQIMAELTKISGVGPWTVHGALLIYLHRGDVVPVGDILLKNTIKTWYSLDHVPTEQEVTDIAAAWRPYGSLGVNLLFAAAELG
jgi:3-methyladenine DNA glycosylase/8-oxoguanine DNA glycosylase/uncharacterized protein YbjT (DUF2867 family)